MPVLGDLRRATRLAARCAATVAVSAARWQTETEDLSAGGCRVTSKLPLRRGDRVALALRFRGVPFPLEISGTVAWASGAPPYRSGIAFARGRETDASRFVKAVMGAAPALSRALAAAPASSAPRPPAHASPAEDPAYPRPRPAQAQALLVVARAERASGRTQAAAAWLRAAVKLAPDDAELARELDEAERSGEPAV
jgi:hypothetical protein